MRFSKKLPVAVLAATGLLAAAHPGVVQATPPPLASSEWPLRPDEPAQAGGQGDFPGAGHRH